MKIKLKELHPNPFKKYINEGKLNTSKVTLLKESIEKDGFWDNIICRKINGKYELAYGHHRIEAAKEILGNNHEVDIPCKELSDEMMLRIMGNENNMQNEEYAIYQIDQILATKKFLESLPRNSKPHQGKKEEISAQDVSNFLGEKNWSRQKVQQYLNINEKLHPKLLHKMKNYANTNSPDGTLTVSHARAIARLPEDKQLQVAELIKDQKLDSRGTEVVVNNLLNKNIERKANRIVNLEKVKNVITNLEGKEILVRCEHLLNLLSKNKLSSFDIKEKIILKDWLSKLSKQIIKFLEE